MWAAAALNAQILCFLPSRRWCLPALLRAPRARASTYTRPPGATHRLLILHHPCRSPCHGAGTTLARPNPRQPDSATHSPTPVRSRGRAARSMERWAASSAAVRSFTARITSTRYFMRCGVLSSPDCGEGRGTGSCGRDGRGEQSGGPNKGAGRTTSASAAFTAPCRCDSGRVAPLSPFFCTSQACSCCCSGRTARICHICASPSPPAVHARPPAASACPCGGGTPTPLSPQPPPWAWCNASPAAGAFECRSTRSHSRTPAPWRDRGTCWGGVR